MGSQVLLSDCIVLITVARVRCLCSTIAPKKSLIMYDFWQFTIPKYTMLDFLLLFFSRWVYELK